MLNYLFIFNDSDTLRTQALESFFYSKSPNKPLVHITNRVMILVS